jgi:lysophospholipase L1-like esterase
MFSSERLVVSIVARGTQSFSWNRLVAMTGTLVLAMAPLWGQGSLGQLVIVGDSLSAGFQNFSLYDSDSAPGIPVGGQKHGYAALIAQQAGANLKLPLISYPGIPPVLTIDASGNITRGGSIGGREDPTVQTLNLSVPGFTVADALARSINFTDVNSIDAMALQVLGFPGLATPPPCGALGFQNNTLTLSEAVCATQIRPTPTTILVSIGNNDALGSLTLGTPPTDPVQFAASYNTLLGILASTGAKIFVSNIPDVTSLPFLVPAPAFQASCRFLPAGVTAADFLVPNIAVPDPMQSSFNICSNYAVRSASLIAQARAAVAAYNATIALAAQNAGAIVVDFNKLLRQISRDGYVVGKRHLTTEFLGGLFSLDGIHPTNTGYAILANEVIKSMNSQLRTRIPGVSVESVAANDPLVFPNIAQATISTNFNGTPISGGSFVWFNANLDASGIPRTGAMISLTGSTISFTSDRAYNLAVPNAVITFSSNVTCASTSFNEITNTWMTTVPISGSDEIFLSGLAFPVPASFASAGGKVTGPVTWQGTVASGTAGVSINWKWGAAVYTTFSTEYNTLAIKPTHSNSCVYSNSHHAGTPEGINSAGVSFQRFVTGGARGGGGANFTGGWSGTQKIVPVTVQ